jgi:predicted enzyme related to lactoylglutathione lyase
VPEPKQVKNRVHLDLRGDDHEAEAARLVDAGARVLRTFDNFIVMSDPEGNEFCLTW